MLFLLIVALPIKIRSPIAFNNSGRRIAKLLRSLTLPLEKTVVKLFEEFCGFQSFYLRKLCDFP